MSVLFSEPALTRVRKQIKKSKKRILQRGDTEAVICNYLQVILRDFSLTISQKMNANNQTKELKNLLITLY